MAEPNSAREMLRRSTADDHDAVDRAFAAFDLGRADDYADFLMAQAAAFLPVEAAIDASAPQRAVADWPERRRSDLLRDDLAALGRAPPPGEAMSPFASAAEVLGAIYVLEGSRLGGQMLARGVGDGLPTAFLTARSSAMWRSLLAILERELVLPDDRARAVAAARMVFARFEKGARCRDRLPI